MKTQLAQQAPCFAALARSIRRTAPALALARRHQCDAAVRSPPRCTSGIAAKQFRSWLLVGVARRLDILDGTNPTTALRTRASGSGRPPNERRILLAAH